VLVAKPFAVSFPDELAKDNFIFAMNFITNFRESPCCSEALSQIFTKIAVDPALAPLVFDLYAGPNYPSPPSEYTPLVPTGTRLHNPRVHELDLDTQRIENIYTYNAFRPQTLDIAGSASATREETDTPPSALYLLPSLFNHACSGSATRYNFRNIMIVRTTKDLNEGEEITMPYAAGNTYLDRQKSLKMHMSICDCWLCDADRKDGEAACRRRTDLLSRLDTPAQTRDTSVPTVRAFLRDVEATYSATRGPIRPASARAHHELATAYAREAQRKPSLWPQAISEDMNALESFGVLVQDKSVTGPKKESANGTTLPIATNVEMPILHREYCIRFSLEIAGAFLELGDVPRAVGWVKAGFWLDDISIGGGWALFKIRYKRFLDAFALLEFAQSIAT